MVGVGGPPVDPAVEGQAVLVVLEVDLVQVVVPVALLPAEVLVGGVPVVQVQVVVVLVPLDLVGEDLSTAAEQHMVPGQVPQALQ